MSTEAVAETEIRHGSKIGRFVVVGELGAGGMGVVYAAHDRELDRRVALKVLRGTAASDEERMRMLREGQAMARITHPNVITVYEVGIEGGLVFLAQELLDGGTLGQWLDRPRRAREILDKFVAAGRGLAAAHAAGLVHRDFKPDNVLLGKDGRVRVADFGLARALGPAAEALAVTTPARHAARTDAEMARSPMSPLTETGAVMGTPRFMAPEQHDGARTDERTDQFSFCVALYYALHGDWPFAGETAVALAEAVLRGRIQPPPRGSGVPARLRKIVQRGLATAPDDRYPSMDALLDALTQAPSGGLRRFAVIAGALVLVAGAVVGGYALRSQSADEPVVAPPAPVVLDGRTLTDDRAMEWLAAAVDRGQLDDAVEKYDLAAALEAQAQHPVPAAIAKAAAGLTLVLRGRLDQAQARLADAEAARVTDPIAVAYADLAAAAIAAARGELTSALERSRKCALGFGPSSPVLAALCFELHGQIAADAGHVVQARAAYADGLVVAGRDHALALDLAAAELDVDDAAYDRAAAAATALQATAAARGATSIEARASIVLGRARLGQAATQQALEVLEQIKPETLQAFQVRIRYAIAVGETHALLGDTDDGLGRIEAARAEAEKQGFPGLVLEARLARIEVLVTTEAEGAKAELRALVTDARARGYGRVARLAETVMQR